MADDVENEFSGGEGKCQENDFVDDKIHVFETVIIVDNAESEDKCTHGKMEQHDTPIKLENIKMELPTSEAHHDPIHDTFKIEEGVVKFEFNNGLLYCEECHAYYKDYCTKCGMLIHILNGNNPNSSDNISRVTLPSAILEIRNYFGQYRVFALKLIPGGVKFGPFMGLSRTECQWKIKDGKFVGKEDESEYLNWMQYVRLASNVLEQNLLAFQYEHNLYYESTCHIQEGNELLVYFGEKYEDNLNRNVEMDFMPSSRCIFQDTFACTFCFLGFSSRSHLAQHKTVCPESSVGQFSIEELVQCSSCKIHMHQKEYFQHCMAHCSELNDRKCIKSTSVDQTAEVSGHKTPQHQLYNCEDCAGRMEDPKHSTCSYIKARIKEENSCAQGEMKQFLVEHPDQFNYECGTNEQANFEHPIHNKYSNKLRYSCDTCDYQANRELHLKRHIESKHIKEFNYKCETCDYEAKRKANLKRHIDTKHSKKFIYKCDRCDYKSNRKDNLTAHVEASHLPEFKYKCDMCHYKANQKQHLKTHIETRHLKEFKYKCDGCDYKANSKSHLKRHTETMHLKEFKYKCGTCDYKAILKCNLKYHIKTKHLDEYNYKCETCDYRANQKSHLEDHVKTKHLKEFQYKCDSCDYKANLESHLKSHIEKRHLREFKYKCDTCDYKANRNWYLKKHMETKHLQEFKYMCDRCGYKTNVNASLKRHMKVHVH